jgi:hypothetical protein
MDLANFFTQGLLLVGSFSPRVVLILFLACFIGEAALFFVPYLLEATWLMAGVRLAQGTLTPPELLLLLAASMAGRQSGALLLYFLSRSGSRLFDRYKAGLRTRADAGAAPARFLGKMDFLASPFAVALGRLFWLRIPLTLILGARGQLKMLLGGIAISSLVYDGVYVVIGAVVGRTAKLEPARVVLFSLLALTVVYAGIFAARRLGSAFSRRTHRAAEKEA